MKQYDMFEFVLIPLTPIHIGGGDEANITPDEYRVKGDMVELVSVRRVLTELSDEQLQKWLADCNKGADIAIANLQDRADDKFVTGRIKISDKSKNEFTAGRRNEINSFIRSNGKAIMPGSSLKGVLRTAWLDRQVKKNNIQSAIDGKQLEENAFKLGKATDGDPFADVLVRDTILPENSTMIDAVHTWEKKKGKYGFTSKRQLHKERTLSVCDGGKSPIIEVQIGIRSSNITNKRKELGSDTLPKTPITTISELLKSLEDHHKPIWDWEVKEQFFKNGDGDALRRALQVFSNYNRSSDEPDAALVRIGWAGHAESKLIAGFRKIHRPQAKNKAKKNTDKGTTRHVVNINNYPASFGWALLIRKDKWQEPEWQKPLARTAGSHHGAKSGGSNLLYKKGDKVKLKESSEYEEDEIVTLQENVTEKKEEVSIQDSYGDIAPIKTKQIKGLA